jgi:hypothetical protein
MAERRPEKDFTGSTALAPPLLYEAALLPQGFCCKSSSIYWSGSEGREFKSHRPDHLFDLYFLWRSGWRRCAMATGQVSGRHNMQGVDIVNEPLLVKDRHSVLADEHELRVRHLEFLTVRCPNRKWPESTAFNPVF